LAESLRQLLLSLSKRDFQTRQRLADDLSLFDGYHPEMQAVHEENAAILDDIIRERGWPTAAIVGEDGEEAAWLIVQHAIGLPDFQRRCYEILRAAATKGEIPSWQPAFLLDRILIYEGKPQVYGTGFDWDDDGLMSPQPIADPASVDERRAAVGLPPLAEATALHRRRVENENQPRPANYAERQRSMDAWATSVGWRSDNVEC
jgi:hypothetical protein